ncbi:MAG: hypothetical protein B6D39_06905 [Anaerolineae bacterium UTCFX2]|nr:hypothetical protein [Anaerolineales bacterium]OQY91489.1 MAG: hypothetical protein B6D39_06905 [Anaerolineae bacterium UTCFX2]
MTEPRFQFLRLFRIGCIVGIISLAATLGGCTLQTHTPAPTPELEEVTPDAGTPAEPSPQVVETVAPTAAAKRLMLLNPPGSNPTEALEIQTVLSELAAQDQMEFETVAELQTLDLPAGVQAMVVLAPDPGLANLAAANPGVQFLGIGIEGVPAGSNLSLIGPTARRADQQGFLAGYLASVITPDWRVGAISRSGSVEGNSARLGFRNGAIFFCGLCRPAFPPFVQYPLRVELPEGADQAAMQAAADQLIANAVKTVYLAPGIEEAFLAEYLANAGLNIIGSEPPAEALRPHWIASIQASQVEALRQFWFQLLSASGGQVIEAPLVLTEVNPDLLSEGRQRLVERMLDDLLSGYIDSGVDPTTGEPR